jgi:hypothetical protein
MNFLRPSLERKKTGKAIDINNTCNKYRNLIPTYFLLNTAMDSPLENKANATTKYAE